MIHLCVTENQARLISRAMELYSRLGIGQYDHMEYLPDWDFKKRDVAKSILDSLHVLMTGYHPHAGKGIGSPDIHEDYRVAYDIQKVINHFLYMKRPEEERGFGTVDSYKPSPTSNEPMAVISEGSNEHALP